MEQLYQDRSHPEKMQKLLENFYEMGSQIAHHFDIPYSKRADYIQSAVVLSWRKLDKYQPKKRSTAFSYFYQIIRRDMMDQMRKEKKRNDIVRMISSDDRRNAWIKNQKHYDANYEVVENEVNKDIQMGIKRTIKELNEKKKQKVKK